MFVSCVFLPSQPLFMMLLLSCFYHSYKVLFPDSGLSSIKRVWLGPVEHHIADPSSPEPPKTMSLPPIEILSSEVRLLWNRKKKSSLSALINPGEPNISGQWFSKPLYLRSSSAPAVSRSSLGGQLQGDQFGPCLPVSLEKQRQYVQTHHRSKTWVFLLGEGLGASLSGLNDCLGSVNALVILLSISAYLCWSFLLPSSSACSLLLLSL